MCNQSFKNYIFSIFLGDKNSKLIFFGLEAVLSKSWYSKWLINRILCEHHLISLDGKDVLLSAEFTKSAFE
jgi:hypothetical protein